MTVKTDDWQERIVALKAEDESRTSADIAEMVGVHQGTVRKVLKRHREQGDVKRVALELANGDESAAQGLMTWAPNLNDNVERRFPDWAATTGPVANGTYENISVAGEPIPGQTTVDEQIANAEPEDVVRGTRQLAIDFGPMAQLPSGGTLVLKSEKMASGHFGMGDTLAGSFTARITDLGARERFDGDCFAARPTNYAATITDIVWAVGHGTEEAREVHEGLAVLKDCGLDLAADLLARLVF